MLKRVVSLIVGVCCLLTMTGAFAAMTYTGTTTEYVEGTNNEKIQVTSYVTGAAGDVATYLVYGNEVGEDTLANDGSNIVYVDQYKFASAGTWTISYQTASTNVGADIKLASTITPEGIPATELPAAAVPVSITVTDGTTTYNTLIAQPTAQYGWYEIPYATTAGIVSAVEVDDVAVAAGKWMTGVNALYLAGDVVIEDDSVIKITLATGSATASHKSMTWLAADKASDAEGEGLESIVMVGNVTGGNIQEFGVLLASSLEDLDAFISTLNTAWTAGQTTGTNAQKLPALGMGDEGDFGIRVYDELGFSGTYYALTYCYDGTNLVVADLYSCLDFTSSASVIDLAADDEVLVVEDAAIEG